MNCDSNHSLFLRSNGTLVCWDDHGSLLDLQPFDPDLNYATDVYLGPVYQTIRERLRRNEMPFPDHCAKCFCLRAHHPMDDGLYARERRIETFQIEPSMGCELACPGCIAPADRKTRVGRTPHGHMTLKLDVLTKIVADLHEAGIAVKKFDMQGHGEPLLNKRVWDMCFVLADLYPRATVSICTHANATFEHRMVHSGVNEILFAIDGADQDSYAPWRVNGDFDRAYRFMHDFSITAAEEAPHIQRVWKYVLFAHNDSDDHLLRAQELALKAKVSCLRLVGTQLGPGSKRHLDGTNLPRLDPSLNIVVDTYRIPASQLRAGLAELSKAALAGDRERWTMWFEFMRTALIRLFSTNAEISAEYRLVIDETRRLLLSLPADPFAAFEGRFRDLLTHLNEAASGGVEDRTGVATITGLATPRPAAHFSVAEARTLVRDIWVDEAWYAATYPDIALALSEGRVPSATWHYREIGYFEGRLPAPPVVDRAWYLARYPDVAAALAAGRIGDVIEHFVHCGYREGREPVMPIGDRINLAALA